MTAVRGSSFTKHMLSRLCPIPSVGFFQAFWDTFLHYESTLLVRTWRWEYGWTCQKEPFGTLERVQVQFKQPFPHPPRSIPCRHSHPVHGQGPVNVNIPAPPHAPLWIMHATCLRDRCSSTNSPLEVRTAPETRILGQQVLGQLKLNLSQHTLLSKKCSVLRRGLKKSKNKMLWSRKNASPNYTLSSLPLQHCDRALPSYLLAQQQPGNREAFSRFWTNLIKPRDGSNNASFHTTFPYSSDLSYQKHNPS